MTDRLIHPTPDFDPNDLETRLYPGAYGAIEPITLERFYWVHLDWYNANGILAEHGDLTGLIMDIGHLWECATIEEGLRTFVDHWMIPTAIRDGFPPFDQWDEKTRIAMTSDAEIFRVEG